MRDSIWRTFWACFCEDSTAALRRILSLSGLFLMALRTPCELHSRCTRARATRSAFLPANSSYASRACLRATARSSRKASYPPSYTATLFCARSSSTMRVTQRARNSRSCDTRTTPPRRPRTNDSRRSSPARSRSLVGSSSSTRSNRLSRSAASAARAAWPPDSEVISACPPASRPRSASIEGMRSSRSGAPLAIQRSNATAYASSAPGSPDPRAAAVASIAAVASAAPVRRARYPATVSPGTRSCSCGSQPRKASDGVVMVPARGVARPASSRSRVVLPAPLAPTIPTTSPGATVRSSDSNRARWPCPPDSCLATRVALIRASYLPDEPRSSAGFSRRRPPRRSRRRTAGRCRPS